MLPTSDEYPPAYLIGHRAAIKLVSASTEWGIIVSGSRDGCFIVWDIHKLCKLNSFWNKFEPTCMCIAPSSVRFCK